MENPLLSKLQTLLTSIRGLGNEKPSVREEHLQKLPIETKTLLELLKAQPEDPLNLEILTSLKDFLRLCIESLRWEDRFAGVFALDLINSHALLVDFSLDSLDSLCNLLEEKEARLRSQTATLMGNLFKYAGFEKVFKLISGRVLRKCLEEADKPSGKVLEANMEVINRSFMCLNEKIFLEKQEFLDFLELTNRVINHPLKHIRVLALEILDKLLSSQPVNDFLSDSPLMDRLLTWLESAPADNFTEPRYQGTKTAGNFLLRLKREGFKDIDEVARRVLPRICFNRLYPAESFSKESQRIWKEFVDVNGKQVLGNLISESMEYDLKEVLAQNWEIRETACRAFGELMSKAIVDNLEAKKKLISRKGEILERLLKATGDQYQSVRETAYCSLQVGLDETEIFGGMFNEVWEGVRCNLAETYPEIKKLIVEVLGVLCTQEGKGDLALKIYATFEERIKQGKCQEHLHEEHEESKEDQHKEQQHNKEHKHDHAGDIYDILSGFWKETGKIFTKSHPEILEKGLNILIANSGVLRQEKATYVKESVWRNFGDGLINGGKPFAKKWVDGVLELAFEEIENKENKEKNAVKGFVKRIQNFIGPNILKGRVEALAQGKWVKLYSEI